MWVGGGLPASSIGVSFSFCCFISSSLVSSTFITKPCSSISRGTVFLRNLLNPTVNDTVMKITIAIIGIDIRDSSPALEVGSGVNCNDTMSCTG